MSLRPILRVSFLLLTIAWLGCSSTNADVTPGIDGGEADSSGSTAAGSTGTGGAGGAGTTVGTGGGGSMNMPDAGTCRNSLECGADMVCDTRTGHCVGCLTAADCKPGESCQSSQCAPPPMTCKSSLDCADKAATPICDSSSGKCVGCVASTDCPTNNDCLNHACMPFTGCTNSLMCPTGQVCDTGRGRCVECVGDNDCTMDQKCAENTCRLKCMSDLKCTPSGQLCDIARGYCVRCVTSTDCKPEQYCANGSCVADVCTAGEASCQSNAIATCKADGSGRGVPVPCLVSQTCVASGGTASCKDRVCTPSVTSCEPMSEKIVQCSADGLSSMVKTDCAASSQVCVAAACVPVVCQAGKRYCMGSEVRQCSAKGDTSSIAQTCTSTQYCDASTATATCKARVCTPSQPACNGNVATTCNADGSGFVAGGNDCAPKFCVGGACVDTLFREDFEDGNYDGWTAGTGSYTRSVVTTNQPSGSVYTLQLVRTSYSLTSYDGLYRLFAPSVQPKTIKWKARVNTLTTYGYAYFVVTGTSTADTLVRTYFYYSGSLYLSSVAVAKTFTSARWYNFEARNIDWTTRAFEWYVTDELGTVVAQQAATLGGVGTSVGRIDMYNNNTSYTGDSSSWDMIELLP